MLKAMGMLLLCALYSYEYVIVYHSALFYSFSFFSSFFFLSFLTSEKVQTEAKMHKNPPPNAIEFPVWISVHTCLIVVFNTYL